MSDQSVTQESSGKASKRKSVGELARASLAEAAERDVARRERDQESRQAAKAAVAFEKYHRKFGWTKAQFTEYWQLRGQPKVFGQKQSEWDQLLNREEKRVKAKGKPRKNKDVKAMAPEDAKAHRQKQGREAITRYRAKQAKKADADAAATGKRPLTDEELAFLETAEGQQAPITPEDQDMADILASLRAAEAAEGK